MEFFKGMDISFVDELLEKGAIFRDSLGKPREIFELLAENDVNAIRLRIWNEPHNVPESGGYCDVARTIKMGKIVKDKGFNLMLDFHYSDYWADPGKQNKPAAWKNMDFEALKAAVYDFTFDTLRAMKRACCLPDMVQIGNEIRNGMLFPDGEVPNYAGLTALVNSGLRAVKAVDAGVKTLIHLDQGARYFFIRDWFDACFECGLEDFDIIALSYYPFWHGTFAQLKDAMERLVERYKKPIIVAETAHPWRKTAGGFADDAQERIAGFPATPGGQAAVLKLVANIVAGVSDNMGLGFYYWEPVVLPNKGNGGWESNMGVFDEDGKAMAALGTFGFNPDERERGCAKIYAPNDITVVKGATPALPETVKVLYFDGILKEQAVSWARADTSDVGAITVAGRVDVLNADTTVMLNVVESLAVGRELLPNGDFQDALNGWSVIRDRDTTVCELRPDFVRPFPEPPEYFLFVEDKANYSVDVAAQARDLPKGCYRLSVKLRGTNTTGVEVSLYAKSADQRYSLKIHPQDEGWLEYGIADIKAEGTLSVGLHIEAPAVYLSAKNFSLRDLRD